MINRNDGQVRIPSNVDQAIDFGDDLKLLSLNRFDTMMTKKYTAWSKNRYFLHSLRAWYYNNTRVKEATDHPWKKDILS